MDVWLWWGYGKVVTTMSWPCYNPVTGLLQSCQHGCDNHELGCCNLDISILYPDPQEANAGIILIMVEEEDQDEFWV